MLIGDTVLSTAGSQASARAQATAAQQQENLAIARGLKQRSVELLDSLILTYPAPPLSLSAVPHRQP